MTGQSMRLKSAVIVMMLAALATSPAAAYNDPTHEQIVADAFEYILTNTTSPVGRADYALLRSVLAHGVTDPALAQRRIRAAAKEIAGYAVKTDQQPDVVMDLPLAGPQPSYKPPFMDLYFFTVFAHFVNVHRPGSLWQDAGYNYLFIEANQRCVHPSNEDKFGNLFVAHSDAKVVTTSSVAMRNFEGQLKSSVDRSTYERQFTNVIRFVEFWPLTNLAKYWYVAFVESGASATTKTPYSLQYLGHVLHAVADSTVPYHAAGISGCGHRAYEKTVDVLYRKKLLVDHQLIATYLATLPHLVTTGDIAQLIRENARMAADRPLCDCDGQTCDCAEALNSVQATAKKLVSLAVASTVASIRVAFRDWEAHGKPLKVSGARPTHLAQAKRVMYADFPVLLVSEDAAKDKTLVDGVGLINRAVLSYAKQESSEAEFQKTYAAGVDNVAKVAVSKPATVKFGVEPGHQEFADPTLEQIQDPQKWAAYLKARARFYAFANLLEAGVARAYFEGRMTVVTNQDEKQTLEHGLAVIGPFEKSAMAALKAR